VRAGLLFDSTGNDTNIHATPLGMSYFRVNHRQVPRYGKDLPGAAHTTAMIRARSAGLRSR
jgi:hypothetical protein